MINSTPRVRFAPSPTGYLHVGGLRTALYNYLFAKNQKGEFILRIEDTDQNRFVEGAVENLLVTLKWVGLEYDEGPGKEASEIGAYYQSKRLEIYKKYADELIQKGKAYYCFCTAERLNELREEQQRLKLPQAKYDKHCLALSMEEVQQKLANAEPHVIRLNIEPGEKVVVNDLIRGRVEFDRDTIDDQVLIKSDGFPTYHLANVVDDHLMRITHVIRGEEWLTSTPKHILLYQSLEWELPQFAHLPLLLNPDRSKLSKRQGDVAVEDYRAKGYFKESILNFVALLGWSAGDNQEIFSMDELVEKFSIDRVHKAGAIFNLEKLNWLNFEHLKTKANEDLLQFLKEELRTSQYSGKSYDDNYLLLIIAAMKERVNFVKDYISTCAYFYERPTEYEQKAVEKNWKPETPDHMTKLIDEFSLLNNPTKEDFEHIVTKVAENLGVGKGKLIHPLRLAVSGQSTGPGMFDLLFILGKDEVITRMKMALASLVTPIN
ncbi:MAG: glutamate--tRNA ligase [bacterium]